MRWTKKQLQDPRWQRKRLEIFNRDGWKCCNDNRDDTTLHAHYLVDRPGHEPWEYHDDEIITLCRSCHYNTHQDKTALFMRLKSLESQQRLGWDYSLSLKIDLVLMLIESEQERYGLENAS